MANKTKCTPETIQRFCDVYRNGMFLELALQHAGIDEKSYYNWMEAAEEGKEPFLSFRKAMEACDSEFCNKNLQLILQASHKDWRAAEWLLSRKFSSNYSRASTKLKLQKKINKDTPIDKIMDMQDQILEQVASGKMSLEDAKIAAAALEEHRRVAETVQIKDVVAELEQKVRAAGV